MADSPSSPGTGKEYASRQELIKATHGTRPLSELLKKTERAQYHLVEEAIRTALSLYPETKNDADKILVLLEALAKNSWREGTRDHKLEMVFNAFAKEHGFDLRILANGHKGRRRAYQKQNDRGQEDHEITDLVRITVCSERSPGILDQFTKELTRKLDHTDDGHYMNPGGLFKNDTLVAIDGIVGEVHTGEKSQELRAYRVSHGIYDIRRDFDTYAKEKNDNMRQSIIRRYNAWAKLYGEMLSPDCDKILSGYKDVGAYVVHLSDGTLDSGEQEHISERLLNFQTIAYLGRFLRVHKDAIGGFDMKPLAKSATEEQIKSAMEGLQTLHQLVHVAYISHAAPEWRQAYVDAAHAMNNKAGQELMPQKFLNLIPGVIHTGPSHGRSHA